jgi:hypothetical protein
MKRMICSGLFMRGIVGDTAVVNPVRWIRPEDLTPRPRRPLCLLDVDGVIVLLGQGGGELVFEAVVVGFPVRIAVAARSASDNSRQRSSSSGLRRG